MGGGGRGKKRYPHCPTGVVTKEISLTQCSDVIKCIIMLALLLGDCYV